MIHKTNPNAVFFTAILLATSVIASHAFAENRMVAAGERMCNKIRNCAIQQFEEQQMPKEMVAAMKSMLDGMCEQTVAPYMVGEEDEELQDMALLCIDDLEQLECDLLTSNRVEEVESCEVLKKAVDEAYPDGYPYEK